MSAIIFLKQESEIDAGGWKIGSKMPIVAQTPWAYYVHFCDQATSQAAAEAAAKHPPRGSNIEVLILYGGTMSGEILMSGRDAILVGVPFIALVALFVFRLDVLIFRPREIPKRQPHPLCGVNANGQTMFCDPDGKPSRTD
jgi:hypothetical protein